jgi:hypothetical protein
MQNKSDSALIPASIARGIPPMFPRRPIERDPTIYVKLFASGEFTINWYFLRYDPKSRLCVCFFTGGRVDDLGDLSLDELESQNPLNGILVERDVNIELPAPLSRLLQRKKSAKKRTA